MITTIKSLLEKGENFQGLQRKVEALKEGETLTISGLAGSLRSLLVGLLAESQERQVLYVTADHDSSEKICDDLQLVMGPERARPFQGARDSELEDRKHAGDIESIRSLLNHPTAVVVTSADGFSLKLPPPSLLKEKSFTLVTRKTYEFMGIVSQLLGSGFEKKDFVEKAGDFSTRGGILDVFPFVGENPLRVEFFGDMIESLREFDALSQRSIRELDSAAIVPNVLSSQFGGSDHSASLFDYLHENVLLILDEQELIESNTIDLLTSQTRSRFTWNELAEFFTLVPRIAIQSFSPTGKHTIRFDSRRQPSFNGTISFLREDLKSLLDKQVAVMISCDTHSELSRLKELLSDGTMLIDDSGSSLDVSRIQFSLDSLHEGFILPSDNVAVYTEHQIFNRLKRRGRKRKIRFKGVSAKELQKLQKGDYVVHADYGIGRFDGLHRIRVRETDQEVLRLLYEEKDVLYVNLNYLGKVQKYSSKEGHIPKLTRLGGPEWERLRSRAKSRMKDIARDLIRLYAKRKSEQGFVFEKDTLWQRELEASFLYEDTYDQARTVKEVKEDMEAPFPMDRLVCGDVGFGKTEVAVRAAFKAVMSGKQVAVLVPTTILAQQHYNTFLDRTSKYSTSVQVLSRFKTKREQTDTVHQLKEGSIDIIIGTHRLLSKDIGFKDLGLLVVDEEHRFGVSAKEKIRQLKSAVDTLTLTATPIPRTLHFSLLGARDLSIIATPPRNRLPVITEITRYNDDLVRDAILREVHRGGQVYFVHDRVRTIEELTTRLRTILPTLRVKYAHGQMHSRELERVMFEFMEKKVDVLVTTKIIESGLDLPNVNTIIINRADKFGMAELYQLRGRVGRSNVQAYAYLLAPPISLLPRTTLLRLQAVEEFTELGSGFNLAMRDLEIRGAGNLLGGEQSGFIEAMGFETYTKILDEAITELKEEEFQDLFEKHASIVARKEETSVEADVDALIPKSYVENDAERLAIYRRIYGATHSDQLNEIGLELKDRFGILPNETGNLLGIVSVRIAAAEIGFRRVVIADQKIEIHFPPESDSSFYDNELFQTIMENIGLRRANRAVLSQEGAVLRIVGPISGEPNLFENALQFITALISTPVATHPST